MSMNSNLKKTITHYGPILTSQTLLDAGFDRPEISRMCNNGQLQHVQYGIYLSPTETSIPEEDYIAIVFPESIVCLDSALFYYGYSDFTPRKWTLAFPRNVSQRKIKSCMIPFKPFYYQLDHFSLGKTTGRFNGVTLPVYDRERVICDCFKYRSKMDSEVFSKAVLAYTADSQKDVSRLLKYAKELNLYQRVMELMEVLLNG